MVEKTSGIYVSRQDRLPGICNLLIRVCIIDLVSRGTCHVYLSYITDTRFVFYVVLDKKNRICLKILDFGLEYQKPVNGINRNLKLFYQSH